MSSPISIVTAVSVGGVGYLVEPVCWVGLLASLIGMKAGLFPQVLMLASLLVRTSTSLATVAEDGASLDRVCCTVDTLEGWLF